MDGDVARPCCKTKLSAWLMMKTDDYVHIFELENTDKFQIPISQTNPVVGVYSFIV